MKRLVALVAAGLVMALLLASCSAITSVENTRTGIQDAGFQSVSVGFDATNSLDISVTVSAAPTEEDAKEVAGVVWQDFHERFDLLNIAVHGDGQEVNESYSFAQVQDAFGPRNPAWNAGTIQSSAVDGVIHFAIGLVVAALVVLVIVYLVHRRNGRRRPPPAGPWGGPGYVPAGYPPGAYIPGPYPPGRYPPGQYPPSPYAPRPYSPGTPVPGPYPPGPLVPGPPSPGQYPPGSASPDPHYPPPADPPRPADPPPIG